jgi:hypothetical protein
MTMMDVLLGEGVATGEDVAVVEEEAVAEAEEEEEDKSKAEPEEEEAAEEEPMSKPEADKAETKKADVEETSIKALWKYLPTTFYRCIPNAGRPATKFTRQDAIVRVKSKPFWLLPTSAL